MVARRVVETDLRTEVSIGLMHVAVGKLRSELREHSGRQGNILVGTAGVHTPPNTCYERKAGGDLPVVRQVRARPPVAYTATGQTEASVLSEVALTVADVGGANVVAVQRIRGACGTSRARRQAGGIRDGRPWAKTEERGKAATQNPVERVAVTDVVSTAAPAAVITNLLVRLECTLRSKIIWSRIQTLSRKVERITRDTVVDRAITHGGVRNEVVELLIGDADRMGKLAGCEVCAASDAGRVIA